MFHNRVTVKRYELERGDKAVISEQSFLKSWAESIYRLNLTVGCTTFILHKYFPKQQLNIPDPYCREVMEREFHQEKHLADQCLVLGRFQGAQAQHRKAYTLQFVDLIRKSGHFKLFYSF